MFKTVAGNKEHEFIGQKHSGLIIVKSKMEISSNPVAFSKNTNFNKIVSSNEIISKNLQQVTSALRNSTTEVILTLLYVSK